jgi:hypothetical protein
MSQEFTVGDRVRVVMLPPYVKTADPMPMLRPPNVIQLGEEGTILDRRPGGYWSIHFPGGKFLLDSQYIESADATTASPEMLEAEVISESSHTETLPPPTAE